MATLGLPNCLSFMRNGSKYLKQIGEDLIMSTGSKACARRKIDMPTQILLEKLLNAREFEQPNAFCWIEVENVSTSDSATSSPRATDPKSAAWRTPSTSSARRSPRRRLEMTSRVR